MAIALPSPADVRVIIQTSLTDLEIQAIIEDASVIVEGCVAAFTEARQKAIIKWYAAHLISSSGKSTGASAANVTSKKLGDATTTYSKATLGSGTMGTTYGQTAASFDPDGCVASIGQKPAVFQVLTSPSR